MNNHPFPGRWDWWASFDEEHYIIGPCPTKEAAIEELLDDGTGEYQREDGSWWIMAHIAECQENNHDLASWFDTSRWLEDVAERMDDDGCGSNEDGDYHPLEAVTPQIAADLDRRIKEAIRSWQKYHGLPLKSYWFANMRNRDVVDLPIS